MTREIKFKIWRAKTNKVEMLEGYGSNGKTLKSSATFMRILNYYKLSK
jgi:hypothetical protein